MSIADEIRALARDGKTVSAIARQLGIRYQHAYNVLNRESVPASGVARSRATALSPQKTKPPLHVEELTAGGFIFSARWILSEHGDLKIDRAVPRGVGVYAFAKGMIVHYVGVATMGLSKRLYFYAKPGVTQRTSRRINAILKEQLEEFPFIEIYTAQPPDLQWNGLPVHGSAGLELGLIKKYALSWNMRSAG